VLVGYSGGADSTCLLHLLRECGVDVVAGHLHHGQRPEAEIELKLCEAFCEELGVPFLSGRADVPKIAEDMKMGLEEAGRHARYAFFSQAAFRLECDLIATAHTLTDHVETVLMNIARGCGLNGVAGIPASRENIVRPLLPFSREETRRYCQEQGFWFHDDPANSDLSFSRARIRHRVVPDLKVINQGVEAAISRLSDIAREEDAFLNGMAAAALEQSEQPLNGPLYFLTTDAEISFHRSILTTLPAPLFKRAIRLAFNALGASPHHELLELVLDGVQTSDRGSLTAEGGDVALEWTPESIGLRKVRPTAPFRYSLTNPGETESEEFGWRFTTFEDSPSIAPNVRESFRVEIAREKVDGSLYFRTANQGDTMQPLGFAGRRKLADLMSEFGLTTAARARLPIVCDMIGPIWAPGVCLSDRVSKGPETSRVVVVEFTRLEDK
jgi:tRNA(Ile)-lysidine synthase